MKNIILKMKTYAVLTCMCFLTCSSIAQIPQCIEMQDQAQTTIQYTIPGSNWQSFTCEKTGSLTKIDAHVLPSVLVTMNIYKGEGTEGEQLYSQSYDFESVPLDWYSFNTDPSIFLEEGQKYSIQFDVVHWSAGDNAYDKGNSSYNSDIDFVFRTHIFVCDEDGDGIDDAVDNCPNNPTVGLDFDGSNDYIIANSLSGLSTGNTSHSIEAWLFLDGIPSARSWPLLLGQSTNYSHHWLINPNGSSQIGVWGSAQHSPNLPIMEWIHLATTYNGSDYKLYINGQLHDSKTADFNFQNVNLILGLGQGSESYFNGKMDEVRVWNRALTHEEIEENRTKELTGFESGLVAYYNFNEGVIGADNTALTEIQDLSSPQNNAAVNNFQRTGIQSNWVIGAPVQYLDEDGNGIGVACDEDGDGIDDAIDNCPNNPTVGLDFDGSNDYIIANSLSGLSTGNTSHSIEAWLFLDGIPTVRSWPLLLGQSSNLSHHWLINPNGSSQIGVWGSAQHSPNLPIMEWIHLATTYNGSDYKLYINGQLHDSKTADFNFQNVNLILGLGQGSESYFNGKMDEVRVWNRALTHEEIEENRTKELTGFESGLVAYYNFNEGVIGADNTALTEIQDLSSPQNNATVNNFQRTGTQSNWVIGAPVQYLDEDGNGVGSACDVDNTIVFSASTGKDDASVQLDWRIDPLCLEGATGSQFNLQILADDVRIENLNQDLPEEGASSFGSFTHLVGSDRNINYTINITKEGESLISCSAQAEGTTLAFQEPEIYRFGENLDNIFFEWRNKSKLTKQFNIYRNGVLLKSIEANNEIDDTYQFEDKFDYDDLENSLVIGESYEYCIETLTDIGEVDVLSQQTCLELGTPSLGFNATDGEFPDRVQLSWIDLSSFFDEIVITRDGLPIATLTGERNSYTDHNPVYGKDSNYGAVFYASGEVIIALFDTGYVPTNGKISGKVLTTEGLYPVEGIRVRLEGELGAEVEKETTTDFAGTFTFDGLYYGVEDSMILRIVEAEDKDFLVDSINLELSNAKPIIDNALFLEEADPIEEVENISIIRTFSIREAPDKVILEWEYERTSEDITYFNIFRGSTLIGQMNDAATASSQNTFSFDDLTGLPEEFYLYRFVAYRFQGESIASNSLEIEVQFPAITIPESISATENTSLGVVDLDWSHVSTNFKHFNIYRNEEFLQSINGTSFRDYTGVPGASNTRYSITAVRSIGEADFESEIQAADVVNYPDLPVQSDLIALAVGGRDKLDLTCTIPPNISPQYNYSGFRLYRKEEPNGTFELIVERDKSLNLLVAGRRWGFEDRSGVPNKTYTYELRTFSGEHERTGRIHTTPFVDIGMPFNGRAIAKKGRIELNWLNASNNYSGFVIYRNGTTPSDSIGAIGIKRLSTFTDYQIDHFPVGTSIAYYIKTLRIIDGIRYYSDPLRLNATISIENTGDFAPSQGFSNFTASNHLSNHVRLNWDIGIGNLSDLVFELRREGVLIATLDRQTLTYADYEAPEGRTVEYSIKAIDGALASPEVFTSGGITNKKYLIGRVYREQSQKAIPNMTMAVYNPGDVDVVNWGQTKTDSSGYYRFEVASLDVAYDLRVNAILLSEISNEKIVEVTPDQNEYIVNFVFSELEENNTNEITEIEYVTATADAQTRSIFISWSPENANYDGFEIFRSTNSLGEVLKGEPLFFKVEDGLPGITETYSVRAFQFNGEDRNYSDYKLAVATFPALLPIEQLTAIPAINTDRELIHDQDNTLLLKWSHPHDDDVDSYIVKRNGILLAEIESGTNIVLEDSTAVPEQLTLYSVVAQKDGKQSPEVFLNTYFPRIRKVSNLQIEIPTNVAEDNNTQNYNRITWEYPDYKADGFEIYRDGMLLAKLKDDIRSYEDYSGIPETAYTYSVVAMVNRANFEYLSIAEEVITSFPKLAFPEQRNLIRDEGNGLVHLSFQYPYAGATTFRVYRNNILLNPVIAYDPLKTTYTFIDNTGTPEQDYSYTIEAMNVHEHGNAISDRKSFDPESISFPRVPNPTNFTATDNFYNHIQLNWTYSNDLLVDNFILKRKLPGEETFSQFALIEGGKRTYADIIKETLSPSEPIQYKIIAQKSGFESTGVDVQGEAGIIYSSSPVFGIVTPINVEASDDEDEFTKITWNYPLDRLETIEGFKIYRNYEKDYIKLITGDLATINEAFDDNGSAIPGKKYIYRVVAFFDNLESDAQANEGASKADGIIEGTVKTLIGDAPVKNVDITISAEVEGEFYQYHRETDDNGYFNFSEVYYGTEGATYSITPVFEDHEFLTVDPVDIAKNMSANVSIFDKTAYVIQGVVRHEDIEGCGIEGIEVKAIHTVDGRDLLVQDSEKSITAADGTYSLVINPTQEDLEKIRIVVENTQTIGEGAEEKEINYNFVLQGSAEFEDFDNLPIKTALDIYDVTRYQANIKVQTTCELPISDAQFTIRARTLDGCYEDYFELPSSGMRSLMLPPLNLVLSVDQVNTDRTSDIVALNYLKNNPVSIDLYDIHLNEANSLTTSELIERTTRTMTYHLPPTIQISDSNFEEYLCEDENKPAIVQQGASHTINFRVTEAFDGASPCDVKEGYLMVTNSAAEKSSPVRLNIDKETGAIDEYEFTVGNPNLVSPHIWSLQVEYFSASSTFQGAMNQLLIVEGEVPLPGSDIIVNPMNGENVVPLPMYVLRDPPGDLSYSSLESGYSFKSSYSIDKSNGGSAGFFIGSSFLVAGIGGDISFSGNFQEDAINGRSVSFEATTTDIISTSATETGRLADKIVGIGVAMQYGILQQIEVTDCSEITQIRKLGFSPNSIETTWSYSVGFIEKLITEYKTSLPLLESGARKILKSSGKAYTPNEAKALYQGWINNWEKVLEYHKVQTNPLYSLCSQTYNGVNSTVSDINMAVEVSNEIRAWRNGFCSIIGSDPGPDFTLDESSAKFFEGSNDGGIPIDADLLSQYNNTATAIFNLQNPDITNSNLAYWRYSNSNLNSKDYLQSIPSSEKIPLAQPMASNVTFSGGGGGRLYTSNNIHSSTRSLTQNVFNELNFGAGINLAVGQQVLVAGGIGAIIGSISTLYKVTGEVRGNKTIAWGISEDWNTSVNTNAASSYFLGDSNSGDQFSTTILKSLAPNHTPYFQLFGGRSSCPPEEGTIFRDNPMVQVNTAAGGASTIANQLFVPADEAAEFTLILDNSNAFFENRNLRVFLDPASNPDNARITFAGQILTQGGVLIDPSIASDTKVAITRGSIAYDYSNLRIGVRPECDEDATNTEYITLNVSFQAPCSPVTIVTPSNNWLMNSTEENLLITVRDYQPNNALLEDIVLEYRRIEAASEWRKIPTNYLAEGNNCIASSDLEIHNDTYFGPGQTPEYYFTWMLPEDLNIFSDGAYELRVVANCKDGDIVSKTYSNTISGRIDRQGLRLFGLAQPSDGIWTLGDEITATFNKNLNCGLMDSEEHQIANFTALANGEEIDNADFVCKNSQIQMTVPDMTMYNGQQMSVTLNNVVGVNGNIATPIVWDFRVATQTLYWSKDIVSIELYEGTSANIKVLLQNVALFAGVNFNLVREGSSESWLSYTPAGEFAISGFNGKEVDLSIQANSVGEYNEFIRLRISGSALVLPKFHIKVKVLPQPPYHSLELNEAEFESSMKITTNFIYSDEQKTSIDTMDQISAWLDGEYRGKARIRHVGDDFYVAYLEVFGRATDIARNLDFMVWDASENMTFDANPNPDNITFQADGSLGSTAIPRLLEIDNEANHFYQKIEQSSIELRTKMEQHDLGISHVFPVPASEVVRVKFWMKETSKIRTKVFDLRGRLVSEKIGIFYTGNNQLELDISRFSEGVYFLKMVDDTGDYAIKQIVVKH